MLTLTEKIVDSALGEHLIRDVDLANFLPGTHASRHGLVNKALKAKELIKLRRGLYTLAPKYLTTPLSLYYLANRIVPYSFVTAESALDFHGWIPERTVEVVSISLMGRTKQFDTPYGRFTYHVVLTAPSQALMGVRYLDIETRLIWMASPLRALVDMIHCNKIDDTSINFLTESLRIDEEKIHSITKKEILEVEKIYKTQRIQTFLKNLREYHDTLYH